ncbi:MAG: hypothetical protein Q4F97_11970 [Bacteroidales bacterium]|nr:hypothetical protein [Bacteroidales bacterium]
MSIVLFQIILLSSCKHHNDDVTIENESFRLAVDKKCIVQSLVIALLINEYWNICVHHGLKINLDSKNNNLYSEIGKHAYDLVEMDEDNMIIPLSDKLYLKSKLSLKEIINAFEKNEIAD